MIVGFVGTVLVVSVLTVFVPIVVLFGLSAREDCFEVTVTVPVSG